jgi:hypothetical protein
MKEIFFCLRQFFFFWSFFLDVIDSKEIVQSLPSRKDDDEERDNEQTNAPE